MLEDDYEDQDLHYSSIGDQGSDNANSDNESTFSSVAPTVSETTKPKRRKKKDPNEPVKPKGRPRRDGQPPVQRKGNIVVPNNPSTSNPIITTNLNQSIQNQLPTITNIPPEPSTRVIRIKEFDLNTIPPFQPSDKSGVKIVVIGKAGTGKSTVIQQLIASKAHIAPVIQVFNGTEDSNGSYSARVPPIFVHDKLDLNAMVQFKNRQTFAAKNIPENPWAIQVIDDCTDNPKDLRHPIVQAYYKNGRHWHMIHILSLQYALDIMPNIRTNIDYVFLMKENTKKTRKKLFENYCPDCVESIDDFNALMDSLTEDYGAMVINNKATTMKIEDMIYYFKADPNAISPAWKFGHPTCWDFNDERFDPNYVSPVLKL